MQAEAVLHLGLHPAENLHLYTKDLNLLLHPEVLTIHTTAVPTLREEALKTDTLEIHTTETVLHQAQATLAAAHLQEDSQEADPASPVVHLQEEATAEVHQEAIDDNITKT